jgi:uncharacterized SAM-binding protein YcdF (DUF218 family)
MSSPNRNPRRRLIAAIAVGFATALVLVATLPQILNPPHSREITADVVFVHVGGEGERLSEAMDAMTARAAPVLAIPTDPANEWVPEGLCDQREPFEVVCLDFTPTRTAAEARAFADLALERGWTSATVITTDYHMTRALMIDGSCMAIELNPRPVESPLTGIALVAKIGHEVIGLPYSWLFDRC